MNIPTKAVKAVIELNGKILLLQRSKDLRGEDNWDLPGGLIENGQTEHGALLREVTEELGIEIEILKPFGTWSFTRLKDSKHVTVQNYLCRVKQHDFHMQLSEEHSSYAWIEPKDITNYLIKDESLKESIYKEYFI